MDAQVVTKTVYIRNELGLHARPAAMLAQAANAFQSRILLTMDGNEVNAKSVLDILSLAAAKGREITLTAHGIDAESAVDQIEKHFLDGFGEE
jgi:phosphocarrier protein